MLRFDPLLPLMPHPFQGNKSFIAFSNLGDTDSLTKTWKVRPSSPPLSLPHTHHHPPGLHKSRQLPRARPALGEPQLASMAPPKPHGRRRQRKVETRIQETEQVDERQARQGEGPVRPFRPVHPSSQLTPLSSPGASKSWRHPVSSVTIRQTSSDNVPPRGNALARPTSTASPVRSSACNSPFPSISPPPPPPLHPCRSRISSPRPSSRTPSPAEYVPSPGPLPPKKTPNPITPQSPLIRTTTLTLTTTTPISPLPQPASLKMPFSASPPFSRPTLAPLHFSFLPPPSRTR